MPSPLQITKEEEHALGRLGGSIGDVTKSLEALNESLLLNSIKDGEYSWRFKHPTVRDAFAKIVASSQDLMDIYLTGAPIEKLFSEISCGDVGLEGTSVIAPKSQYHIIIEKLKLYDTEKWWNKSALCRFLSYRCDKAFIVSFLENFPDFISKLSVGSYIYADSDVDLAVRLHEFRLLPEDERVRFVSEIKSLSVDTPDAGFLKEDIKTLISEEEMADILVYVQESLIPYLENTIDQWKSDYNNGDDPESHFEELKSNLGDYKNAFSTNEYLRRKIDSAIDKINAAIDDLNYEYSRDSDKDVFNDKSSNHHRAVSLRSIFDDVDA